MSWLRTRLVSNDQLFPAAMKPVVTLSLVPNACSFPVANGKRKHTSLKLLCPAFQGLRSSCFPMPVSFLSLLLWNYITATPPKHVVVFQNEDGITSRNMELASCSQLWDMTILFLLPQNIVVNTSLQFLVPPISYFANIKTMSVDGMGWKGLGSCFVITKMSAQELPVHFLLLWLLCINATPSWIHSSIWDEDGIAFK